MSIQTINTGALANDGTGDSLRTAFAKVNANFDDLASGKLDPAGLQALLDYATPAGKKLAPVGLSESADAWCWFHEPRALAAGGKLWFGVNGSDTNSQAGGRATLYEVDEGTGAVASVNVATGVDWGDDHNYPTVMLRPDGRLVVFYCAHRLVAPIHYRVSVAPRTITGGMSQEYTIPLDSLRPTYPSPVMLSAEGNKVYLLFRNGVNAALSYVTSTDIATVSPATVGDGALGAAPVWSSEVRLTVGAGAQGIYTKVHSDGVGRIDILITDAIAGTSGPKVDVRHGYWSAGAWHASDGTALGALPIAFASFSALATSGAPDNWGDLWCTHMQRRSSGLIEAVFVRLVTIDDHRYYYARWDGAAWSRTEIDAGHGRGTPDTRSARITDAGGASEGYYSPGMYLDTVNDGVVYCSVGNNLSSILYRYITSDAGESWTRERVSAMQAENVRPVVPVGRSSKYAVLWMSGRYQFYDFSSSPTDSYGYSTTIKAASLNYATGRATPKCTVLPAVSGTAIEGNVLTATPGTWSGDLPMTFVLQWMRDGVEISGATSASYTVISADTGHALTVSIAATNDIWSASAESAQVSALPINLVSKSEQFDAWGFTVTTQAPNVAANPLDGAVTADRIAEMISTGQHSVTSPAVNFVAGTIYTFSVYVKFETRRFVQLLFGAGVAGSNAYANFDLQDGVVGSVGSAASASIVSLGGGWYRLRITATATASVSSVVGVYFALAADSVRAVSYAGSTSNTALLFGAQVETGGAANTYVPTA